MSRNHGSIRPMGKEVGRISDGKLVPSGDPVPAPKSRFLRDTAVMEVSAQPTRFHV